MEKEKNNKKIIALLVIIIALLSVSGILFATGKISFKTSNKPNNNINEEENIEDDKTNLYELYRIIGIIPVTQYDYSSCLSVAVSNENYKDNIKNIFSWYTNLNGKTTYHYEEEKCQQSEECKRAYSCAACSSVAKKDAEEILRLYNFNDVPEFLSPLPAYEDEYSYTWSMGNPVLCNYYVKHNNTTSEYINSTDIRITDVQTITEYEFGYEKTNNNIKSLKNQTVLYDFKKDSSEKYYLSNVQVTDENQTDINDKKSVILDQIYGVYGNGNYILEIRKQSEEYKFLFGQYASDGGISGYIKNIKELDVNKYELEVFEKGCKGAGCMKETEDETRYITIEVDNNKNIIKYNDNEYEFITKNISDNETIYEFFYPNWANYLLSSHLLNAKITRIRDVDLGDSSNFNKTITITKEELEEILGNLKTKKITKTWSLGRGGPIRDKLTISYEKDDQKYELEIYNGSIYVSKLDEKMKNILESNKSGEKYRELKDKQGASFYYYNIENYDETIFDKYFNKK